MTTYYDDYPKKPIGGGNPYMECQHCGRSAPDINGRIEGHNSYCLYRINKEAELRQQARDRGQPTLATLTIEIPDDACFVDEEGNEIDGFTAYEHLFESTDKGVIVQEVVKYLDQIKPAKKKYGYEPMQWAITREAFKLKLYAAYVEHTTSKPLGDFLLVEQDDKAIPAYCRVAMKLEFSH